MLKVFSHPFFPSPHLSHKHVTSLRKLTGVKKKSRDCKQLHECGTEHCFQKITEQKLHLTFQKTKKLRAHTLCWQSFSPVSLSGVFLY